MVSSIIEQLDAPDKFDLDRFVYEFLPIPYADTDGSHDAFAVVVDWTAHSWTTFWATGSVFCGVGS